MSASKHRAPSLLDLFQRFNSPRKGEDWFVAQRWPDGNITCPHCNSDNITDQPRRKPQRFHCRSCRKYFSVRTGTVFQHSNIPLNKWAVAFYLYASHPKGISSIRLAEYLGVTQKTAWHMQRRIREAWKVNEAKFTGPVEVDETYVGGLEKNKHEDKKLRAGRGGVGKTPVLGMLDRDANQVKTQVAESTDGSTLKGFVHMNTEFNAQVYTDEAKAYEGLNRPHEAVSRSTNEYVRSMAYTNGLESHWALFKRGIDGIYDHVSGKHLPCYTAEFSGRYNNRPRYTEEQMEGMVKRAGGKRMTYERLVA